MSAALNPHDASVLIVEDNPDDAFVLARVLQEFGIRRMYAVDTGEAALEFLRGQRCDVVFVDYSLPRMNGLIVLQRLLAAHPGVRVILVTGVSDEHVAVDAMKSGAADYVPKDSRLTSGVIRSLQAVLRREIDEANQASAGVLASGAGALDVALREARWLLESSGAAPDLRDGGAEALAVRYGRQEWRDLQYAAERYLRESFRRFPEPAAEDRKALVRAALDLGLSPSEIVAAYLAALAPLAGDAALPCHPVVLLAGLLAGLLEGYQMELSMRGMDGRR